MKDYYTGSDKTGDNNKQKRSSPYPTGYAVNKNARRDEQSKIPLPEVPKQTQKGKLGAATYELQQLINGLKK